MAREIKITKVGKSTIVDVKSNDVSSVVTYVFNKPTDIVLQDDVLSLEIKGNIIFVRFEELFDKLGATTLKEYVTAAATALLFTNN